jgi:hypothetical protein
MPERDDDFLLAVLDDDNVLTGYEKVPEATWRDPPARRVPMHDRDLKPHRYAWTGETFLPLPLGGEDDLRRPRLLKAIVGALLALDDAMPATGKLKPQIRDVLEDAKRKFRA